METYATLTNTTQTQKSHHAATTRTGTSIVRLFRWLVWLGVVGFIGAGGWICVGGWVCLGWWVGLGGG